MEISNPKTPQELEVKLIIIHSNPDQFADKISKLDKISRYQLNLPESKQIHDTYFDNAEETFKRNRMAFRVRIENDQQFITVKGKTKVRPWGGVERIEIENPWSIKTFQKTLMQLEQYGIILQVKDELLKDNNPVASLKRIGFSIIQDRHTFRLTRQIESGGDIVAELAIDKVDYQVKDRQLIHYEIELEAKNPQGPRAIQEIQQNLQSTFGDSLKVSVFSKLMLGMILKELPENQQFFDLQKPVSSLYPAAYSWIEEKLEALHE
jgi:inorganic triphosphatase YgiF